MRINPATLDALPRAAELLRYQNKQMEVKRLDENLRQEYLRLQRLKPSSDPTKGQNVDLDA
jgi:hypothetical protein